MKRLANQSLAELCATMAASGHHVDSRLIRASEQGHAFSFMIEDEDTFLSLIWQESDSARLFTPKGQSRTLRDVAQRLIQGQHTFHSLANDLGLSKKQHSPAWFKACVPISQLFSYDAFGFVGLVQASDDEQRQSPSGTFYIFDGNHRTLVLSTLLLSGQIAFQPIQAVLLIPRR